MCSRRLGIRVVIVEPSKLWLRTLRCIGCGPRGVKGLHLISRARFCWGLCVRFLRPAPVFACAVVEHPGGGPIGFYFSPAWVGGVGCLSLASALFFPRAMGPGPSADIGGTLR